MHRLVNSYVESHLTEREKLNTGKLLKGVFEFKYL